MSQERPLLMIPGPVEVSPAVLAAAAVAPPGHLSAAVMQAFGSALERMRQVWLAAPDSQPFVVAGSGTTAMEMAAANLVEADDTVVVVDTGYFSARMAEMLRRLGARVSSVTCDPGDAPAPDDVARALERAGRVKALFATHVDTSTGVRVDPQPLARLARDHGALSVFDGVCATAGERFEMAAWEADVYLTGSQKALGLPPGLALLVAGARALAVRAARRAAPLPSLDWEAWRPVMQAYEHRQPAYFATPATPLILALDVALGEILTDGVEARWAVHARAAAALSAAWEYLDLVPLPRRREWRAHTLSALRYPSGVDAALVGRIAAHGVAVAGGLHPALKSEYFRVGHMGYAVTRPDVLLRVVEAVALALRDGGRDVDPRAAVSRAAEGLGASLPRV